MSDSHNIPFTSFFPHSDFLFCVRYKSEPALINKIDYESTYMQMDEEYTNNGMTPYTVQFLKRMADTTASNLLFYL